MNRRRLMAVTIDLPDPQATQRLGHRLGELLWPGAVVALVGPLGAGKTYMVRAVAEGLGVQGRGTVTSPTFVLVQEYEGRLPVHHFDAYRLRSSGEFADLGAAEYFESAGVSLVEWADRVEPCLPGEHLRLTLHVIGETARRVVVEGRGEHYADLADRLSAVSLSRT